VVSTREQKLAVVERGNLLAIYPVSTSKFGLDDWPGSRFTPMGKLEVAKKLATMRLLAPFSRTGAEPVKSLHRILRADDPIVMRILWLRGQEAQNANAFSRDIYIHGTPKERLIWTPASYGCIRMRSRDIIQLREIVGTGAAVTIVDTPLAATVPSLVSALSISDMNPAPLVMR